MKRVKVLSPIIFYISFFVVNMFTAFIVTFSGINPNWSGYTTFGNIILSTLGNFGVLLLIFSCVCMLFKKTNIRLNVLLVVSVILTILCLFLNGFLNMFSLFFDYSQLSSFRNPTQNKFVVAYISFIFSMFSQWSMIVIYVPLILLIALRFFIDPFNKKNFINIKYKVVSSLSSLIFMIIPIVIMNVSSANTFYSISMNGLYGSSKAGVYNYYLYNLSDSIFGGDIKLDEKNKEICRQFLLENIATYSERNYTNIADGKNLVFIQMEAINNFVVGLNVNGTVVAPNLTKLATDNLYYRRFYSTAGIGNTSDCEFSTLTGLYPNGNDLSVFNFEGENYHTMAKDFKKKGYNTFSIHGNEGGFYNRSKQHVEMLGFDKHYDREALLERNPNLNIINDWISDNDLLKESINIFLEQDKPFFAYDILVTSHSPFANNENIPITKYKGLTKLASDYLDYVKYVDTAIGNFMALMEENGLLDNTIIMIFADHTSQLQKDDLESLLGDKLNDVEYRSYMQNVPLIMVNPIFDKLMLSDVYSLVDLYPTISNLFGLNSLYKFGADILNSEDTYCYSPRSLDLIFADYIIMYPSKSVYYTKSDAKELTKEEINKLCEEFAYYKYHNDLLLVTEYFK